MYDAVHTPLTQYESSEAAVDLKAQAAGKSLPLGIALITTASLCSAVMSTLSKEATGVPPLLTLFLQYGVSFLLFVPSVAHGGVASLKTAHFGLHLFRSLAGSVCQLLFFVAVLLVPVCLFVWKPLSERQWLLLLGVGLSYAATQYLIILAYRYASAAELSPFNYSVVIFSCLLGWKFFGSVPDGMAVVGTVLICAGGILSIEAGHIEGLGHASGNGHWNWRWKFGHNAPRSAVLSHALETKPR